MKTTIENQITRIIMTKSIHLLKTIKNQFSHAIIITGVKVEQHGVHLSNHVQYQGRLYRSVLTTSPPFPQPVVPVKRYRT